MQNHSPQIEGREAHLFTKFREGNWAEYFEGNLSWSTLDWFVTLVLQVSAEVWPGRQLTRPFFQRDMSAEFNMPTCGNTAVCRLCKDKVISSSSIFFWTKVTQAGLPRKAFPRKQAKADISVFRFRRLSKQRPRIANGQPRLLWNERTCLEQLEVFPQWMKSGEGWACRVQWGYMWQRCRLWAMQRKTKPFFRQGACPML